MQIPADTSGAAAGAQAQVGAVAAAQATANRVAQSNKLPALTAQQMREMLINTGKIGGAVSAASSRVESIDKIKAAATNNKTEGISGTGNIGEIINSLIKDGVSGLSVDSKAAYGGLSKDDYLHTDSQDINMFYAKGEIAQISTANGRLTVGAKGGIGVGDVSVDAFGTNKNGKTGGLNIGLINASGFLGINEGETAGIGGELALFKVGGFVRDAKGKTLFELNVGYGISAGYSTGDLFPAMPKGLLVDLTIVGIPIL